MGNSFLLAAIQKERMKKRSRIRRRRQQREIQDSKHWIAPEITMDLLIEILTRLPRKSVMRFKCVSKFWSTLLCSRYFCNRFLMVPSRPQPRLYMCLLDLYHRSKAVVLSSAPSTTCASPLVFDQDLTIPKMGGFFLRILRGFICFTHFLKARIYNPTTKQLVILPAIEESDIIGVIAEGAPYYTILYFICHDPVNDQYKLLCTVTVASDDDVQDLKSELWIFVLEAGGSWKRVAKEFPHHLPSDLELNMNGVLYYLAWTDSHTCLLVSFDVRSEEFNTVQVPRKAGDILPRYKKGLTPINYGGKIAVFDFTFLKRSGTMDLWVLEDARKKEWSRKTLVLQPSRKHLVTHNFFVPKGTTRQGKVVLVPQKLIYPFYFLYYDLQNNYLEKVEIKGVPDRWFRKPERNTYFDMEFMDPSESIMYLET